MRHITDISELRQGMVVLTGTAFYLVTDTNFPHKFRGHVWSEVLKQWGSLRDVPFPSPTHPLHEVPQDEAERCFPSR